jgi:PAS domain S-box-containing protein
MNSRPDDDYQSILEERELLKRVVTHSADATCLVDMDRRIIEWNPAAERLFGWNKEEILGRPLSTIIPAGAAARADDILKREREGKIVDEIVPRLRKDGTVFEAELKASGVRDPEGNIIGYVGTYRDVTERVLVETASSAVTSELDPVGALTRFGEVLKEVFDFTQLTLSVIEGDHYRRVVSVGDNTQGFTRNEVVPLEGNSVREAVETRAPVIVDDTSASRLSFDERLARSGVGSYVIVPLIEDGRVFASINVGFSQPHVPNDKMVHLVASVAQGVAQGIKNVLLYEQQRESLERLQAIDEMKNSFLQAVSHELRTPLTAVLGLALTLEKQFESFGDEQRKEILGMLAFNARKLDRLLTDLLDLDRLTRGVLKPYLRPLHLGDLIDRMADEVDTEGRLVEIDSQDVQVVLDGAKVERIVENLLVNAVRHTPEESRIWIRAADADDGVLIVVEDDGPGVSDESKEAIFEVFRQGPERAVSGTGVGLTLVSRFAQLHGGRAWVEDRPGGGASFRVLLPHAPE